MEFDLKKMYIDFQEKLEKNSEEEIKCDLFFSNLKNGVFDSDSPYVIAKYEIDNFIKPSIDLPSISKFTNFFEQYSANDILNFLIQYDQKIPIKIQLRGYEVLLKKASLEIFDKAYQAYRGTLLFYGFTWDSKVDEMDIFYKKRDLKKVIEISETIYEV